MYRTMLTLACAGVLSFGAAARPAEAQSPDRKSVFFTFSQPVTLPQITLAPGRYLFQLADSQANRTIVQVYSADRSKLYGMMMTLSARRTQPSDEPQIRFLETSGSAPQAIATWWYPGENTGWEFIYPREQAMTLAKTSAQPVLTTTTDTSSTDAMRTAELTRVDRTGQQTAANSEGDVMSSANGQTARGEIARLEPDRNSSTTSATAAPSASDTIATATAASSPAANPTNTAMATSLQQNRTASSATTPADASAQGQDQMQSRTTLPSTASPLPLIVALGLLAIAASTLLRLRRHTS